MSLSLPNSASVDNAKASRKAPRVIGGKVRQWVLKNPWRAAGLAVFLTLSLATATLSTAVYQLYALPLPTRFEDPRRVALDLAASDGAVFAVRGVSRGRSVELSEVPRYLIDAVLVDGTARLPRLLGKAFRPLQNGVLQSYAVSMAGGVGLVALLVLLSPHLRELLNGWLGGGG